MKIEYYPSSKLEKFGFQVCKTLVDNFSNTFYVGGMVRDLLLNEKITDIDIATIAQPSEVIRSLSLRHIQYEAKFQRFGIIIAKQGGLKIEVATFRKDLAGPDRYPKVLFLNNPKVDSIRRDFTVNALYLEPKGGKILDFHEGLKDLRHRRLKFIGSPARRIQEDPLRIIRALRFSVHLGFNIESKTKRAMEKYFVLTKKISKNRIETEIKKLSSKKQMTQLQKLINNYSLD
jgi:poly(A) polymerase